MNELLKLTALELAELIREKKVSPTEVVEAHIERIEKVNPIINAVIETDFDYARQAAKDAEKKLSGSKNKNNLPPLLGVPCTIKDTFAQEGLPWSAGCKTRKDVIADGDATVVARLKGAGAIPLGRTNVPEAAMWIETYNKVYGRTRNPHHPKHIVGGSSGGEGAIIAAGGSPFGPGSDIGGSIRYPSFFNGVIGHKPTGGLVPNTGHYPVPAGPAKRYNTNGALGRSVDDVAFILGLLAGPDGKDDGVIDKPLGNHKDVKLRDVRVYFYSDNSLIKPSHDVVDAVHQAANALEARGCTVEEWCPADLKSSLMIWMAKMNSYDGEPFAEVLGNGKRIPVFREALKALIGMSDHSAPGLVVALAEELAGLTGMRRGDRMSGMVKKGDALQAEIEEKLGPMGVLICPPYNQPAPKHDRPWLSFPAISYSAIYNVLEFPATMTPITWTKKGLPVGVQVVGSRFSDHVTLAVARALEEDFGGWQIADTV